jgi:hypothetical protein
MSQHNGTGRRTRLGVGDLLTEVVAEAVASLRASDVEDRGWRRGGSKTAADRTLADLDAARSESRRLLEGTEYARGNQFAIGAAEIRANYAVGDTGLAYAAEPARDGVDPGLVAAVQDLVDLVWEKNDLPAVEAETVYRLDRDGDAALRIFPGADGVADLRFVEPERVVAPPATLPPGFAEAVRGYDDDMTWGVVHKQGDRGVVLGYWVEAGPGGAVEFVPESDIVWFKINTTSADPRGWPTWEPVVDALRRAEELSVAMTSCATARAKIAAVKTIENFRADQSDTIQSRLTARTVYDGSSLPARVDLIERFPYGAMIRERAGTTWTFPNHSLGSADLVEAIEANLRQAAGRLNMPQWMFSQKTDVKYSNAFTVEAPSHKSFRRLQRVLVQGFGAGRLGQRASVLWRCVRAAVGKNLLPAAVLTDVRLTATAPSLEARDKNAEASANTAYIAAGVKPVAQVQKELGLDPEEMAELAAKAPAPPAAPPPDPGAGPTGAPPDPAAESLHARVAEQEGGPAAAGTTFPGYRDFPGPAPGWE